MDLPANQDYYTLEAIATRSGVAAPCIEKATQQYDVPLSLMYAVLVVENERPGGKRTNNNGTDDLGPAQINTVWLATLEKRGYSKSDIQNDGCKNIEAATWIMSKALKSSKHLWEGIGRYHSKREPHNFKYRLLIYKALRRIKNAMSANKGMRESR